MVWFKKKKENPRGFRVFDLALRTKLKTRKSGKFSFALNIDWFDCIKRRKAENFH